MEIQRFGSISSQSQSLDRILKMLNKSLFLIRLEVNNDKTNLLFVPLSNPSKLEGSHHPLSKKWGKNFFRQKGQTFIKSFLKKFGLSLPFLVSFFSVTASVTSFCCDAPKSSVQTVKQAASYAVCSHKCSCLIKKDLKAKSSTCL